VRLYTGTSGFAYKEWKGNFYPRDISPKSMLSYYGERFDTVEINNTFYRMPSADLLKGWSEQVPDDFVFALKAPRTITHIRRLKNVDEVTEHFIAATAELQQKQGPILFQFPGNFAYDRGRFVDFLRLLQGVRAVFEFRHESWANQETFGLLSERDFAFCISDGEPSQSPAMAITATWGYLRMRQPRYSDSDLAAWRSRIRESGWESAYVFFKHEAEGAGPQMSRGFKEAFTRGL
jgi:uncharacterized protein YecE (DUF72 family)